MTFDQPLKAIHHKGCEGYFAVVDAGDFFGIGMMIVALMHRCTMACLREML